MNIKAIHIFVKPILSVQKVVPPEGLSSLSGESNSLTYKKRTILR